MTLLHRISSSHNIPCKVSLLCVSAYVASVCRLLHKLYYNQGEDTHGLFHLHTLHPPMSEEQNNQYLWVKLLHGLIIDWEDICLIDTSLSPGQHHCKLLETPHFRSFQWNYYSHVYLFPVVNQNKYMCRYDKNCCNMECPLGWYHNDCSFSTN